jgi:hypothetical protein
MKKPAHFGPKLEDPSFIEFKDGEFDEVVFEKCDSDWTGVAYVSSVSIEVFHDYDHYLNLRTYFIDEKRNLTLNLGESVFSDTSDALLPSELKKLIGDQ